MKSDNLYKQIIEISSALNNAEKEVLKDLNRELSEKRKLDICIELLEFEERSRTRRKNLLPKLKEEFNLNTDNLEEILTELKSKVREINNG